MLAGAALVVLQSIAHLIATYRSGVCDGILYGPCGSTFDLEQSNGVSDVVSEVVIGAAALGAIVLGVRRFPDAAAALALAVVLVLIDIDDTFRTEDNTASVYGLVVLGSILAAAALMILVAMSSPLAARVCLLVGVAVLALDAREPYWYDQLMNLVGQPWVHRRDLLYELGIMLDEGMELMGWVFVTVGLWIAASAAPAPTPVLRAERAVAATADLQD